MRLILQEEFKFVFIPFGSMVKFSSFAQFPLLTPSYTKSCWPFVLFLLHSSMLWLIISSLSPKNLSLLLCCVQSISVIYFFFFFWGFPFVTMSRSSRVQSHQFVACNILKVVYLSISVPEFLLLLLNWYIYTNLNASESSFSYFSRHKICLCHLSVLEPRYQFPWHLVHFSEFLLSLC